MLLDFIQLSSDDDDDDDDDEVVRKEPAVHEQHHSVQAKEEFIELPTQDVFEAPHDIHGHGATAENTMSQNWGIDAKRGQGEAALCKREFVAEDQQGDAANCTTTPQRLESTADDGQDNAVHCSTTTEMQESVADDEQGVAAHCTTTPQRLESVSNDEHGDIAHCTSTTHRLESLAVQGQGGQGGQNRLWIRSKFLNSDATSHKGTFGAIAELLDNAVDEMEWENHLVDKLPENPKLQVISRTNERCEIHLRRNDQIPPAPATFFAAAPSTVPHMDLPPSEDNVAQQIPPGSGTAHPAHQSPQMHHAATASMPRKDAEAVTNNDVDNFSIPNTVCAPLRSSPRLTKRKRGDEVVTKNSNKPVKIRTFPHSSKPSVSGDNVHEAVKKAWPCTRTRRSKPQFLPGHDEEEAESSGPEEEAESSGPEEGTDSSEPEEEVLALKKLKKGPKLNVRCNPGDVVLTMAMLTDDQRAAIAQLGFGQVLLMEVDAVESRNLLPWLMDRIHPDTMIMNIGPGKKLPINAEVISIVLGLPNKGTNLRIFNWRQGVQAKRELFDELKLNGGDKLDIHRLMEELLLERVDILSMRCFCMVLFNRLLFPGSSFDISTRDIFMSLEPQRFDTINWAQAVFNDIQLAVRRWHSRKMLQKTQTIFGCAAFLIVYYLDNLHHKLSPVDWVSTPRVRFYKRGLIEALTIADRIKRTDGTETYGLVHFKSKCSTCYAAVGAASKERVRLDVQSQIHSNDVLIMRELLSGQLGALNEPHASVLNSLFTQFDVYVSKHRKIIDTSQNKILRAQLKLADNCRQLIEELIAAQNATNSGTDDANTAPVNNTTRSEGPMEETIDGCPVDPNIPIENTVGTVDQWKRPAMDVSIKY